MFVGRLGEKASCLLHRATGYSILDLPRSRALAFEVSVDSEGLTVLLLLTTRS